MGNNVIPTMVADIHARKVISDEEKGERPKLRTGIGILEASYCTELCDYRAIGTATALGSVSS